MKPSIKQLSLLVFLLLFIQILNAQKISVNEYAAIDAKALQIPDSLTATTAGIAGYINSNFATDKEKARAAFIWVASNIQYDIDNMFALNFYEAAEEKIDKPLKTRKGICENYAALFNDICAKCNIKSFMVPGYTKQNGFTDYIPHVWCAAYIDTAWFLFDPTWGSGYIMNSKFYKRIDNKYFEADPSFLIKTHIPFDYLWQCLNYPVSNQEFYEGKTTQNTTRAFFNYADSIALFEQQNHIEQLTAEARRIEKNGVKNSMIFDRLRHIKLDIENDKIDKENKRQAMLATLYNDAVAYFNGAVKDFNGFIEYRNKQFKPEKTDEEIQGMIDSTNADILKAKNNIKQISNPDPAMDKFLSQLLPLIVDLDNRLNEQQDWLNLYFSKSKAKRKSMFYEKKLSWFGIPLN
ncbi:transglutaminase domain-containing protein [Parafilimonas terrae]|uniref:Transglutaminase-like superfamily protein n=1 Tax=Parafilimonas terrae TaxID=1465490 RepID=A0A1I5Y9S2_9BACT|nr:transglutaminase domain-containing protein [Parafilimonas terrae]SFQ40850.1 Transglutaminase-like superfamily protein [Parafilimonas terrae]